MNITGLHHVTAVTARANDNLDFYTRLLGLRLVKKTVNQDDISAYHLFYADEKGSPGTDMTFFDWKQAGSKQDGTDEVSRTLFRANGEAAIDFWSKRLTKAKIDHSGIQLYAGRKAIFFNDPEGQSLGIVDDKGANFDGRVWVRPDIDKEFALRGFYAVQLTVPQRAQLEPIFTQVLGWVLVNSFDDPLSGERIQVFCMGHDSGPGREVHLIEKMATPLMASTAGSVHHVAFKVRDAEELQQWQAHLDKIGLGNSGIVDRFYFQSLYFRVTRGILFELATEGPGFAADESPESLGERLSLPPFLEPRRAEIEAGLVPLGTENES